MASRPDEHLHEFFALLRGWADAADLDVEVLAYGSHPDQIVELRRAERSRGTVLVLHGGFWRAAYDRSSTVALATALALRGWTTANAEYRRGGPGTWREMREDVAAAADAVDAEMAIGHSAGGHLALWLAGRRRLRRAVALGGVCDLVAAARAGLGGDAVQELLGGDPDEVPAAYTGADPALQLPLGTPQVLIHGGEDGEVPIANARGYAERAQASGDDCRLVELAGVDHYDVIDPRHACFAPIVAALTG